MFVTSIQSIFGKHHSNLPSAVTLLYSYPIIRMRENVCYKLSKRFIDEICIYKKAQEKYHADLKKKITRQIRIVSTDVTEEEVDAIMKSNKGGKSGVDTLYRQLILDGGIHDQVQTMCSSVAGKYQDVLALEQSMEVLHQLFLDLALLTEQQGEQLDRIEFQIQDAGDNVGKGNEQVYESIQYQKKIRKKSFWIAVIVALAATILVAFLFA